jgi:hypothetical protein
MQLMKTTAGIKPTSVSIIKVFAEKFDTMSSEILISLLIAATTKAQTVLQLE